MLPREPRSLFGTPELLPPGAKSARAFSVLPWNDGSCLSLTSALSPSVQSTRLLVAMASKQLQKHDDLKLSADAEIQKLLKKEGTSSVLLLLSGSNTVSPIFFVAFRHASLPFSLTTSILHISHANDPTQAPKMHPPSKSTCRTW